MSAKRRKPQAHDTSVAVIGLGRFGASLAAELMSENVDVLGLDRSPDIVQRYADDFTNIAVVDSTDPVALKQLGLDAFDHVVVGIGSDLESSVLTTSVLVELGIRNVWVKATSRQHGRILERVGAHHVVLPEHDMGERVAHLVLGSRMLDYVEFDHSFAMAKAPTPSELVGIDLKSSRVRSRYDVTIVAVQHVGGSFDFADLDTVIAEGDVLIVAGRTRAVERFAAQQ